MRVQIDSWAWLDLKQLTPGQVYQLKKTLTIQPRKVGDHPGPVPGPIRLYVEDETNGRLGVPREFFLASKQQQHELTYAVTDGDRSTWPGDLTCAAQLRDEQQQALALVVHKLHNGNLGGILRASPGWGKTVWACALIARLQVPTLVVVHKEFLLAQWKERIEQFLPGCKVGICQQNDCEYGQRHVVVGMVHSLAQKDYPTLFYRWPGLVITDEVHRIGAETWASVPPRFTARWRVGLSATPRRKDGADAVFQYHIGPLLFTAKEQRLKAKVKRVWTSFRLVKTPDFDPSMMPRSILLRFLCKNQDRNRQVVEQIIKAVQAGRKLLVLSERLQHLRDLRELFEHMWVAATQGLQPVPTSGFYVGGMAESALKESAQTQVIFATSQMTAEGLDIPAIDTLFLTTPLSDVEQAVGRILRPFPGKKDPIVVDFVDEHVSKFNQMAKLRDKHYPRFAT